MESIKMDKFTNIKRILLVIIGLVVSQVFYFMRLASVVNNTISYEVEGNLTFSDAILGDEVAVGLLAEAFNSLSSFMMVSRVIFAVIGVVALGLFIKKKKGMFSIVGWLMVGALVGSFIFNATLGAVCG